jgi:tRNA(Arg) A34 adenosine deaminase TadA
MRRANKGGPFGAVIVRDGAIVAESCNEVTSTSDPTAHEVVAIRRACAKFGTFHLSDREIHASCEPCPMCLGAIYWARFRALTTRTHAKTPRRSASMTSSSIAKCRSLQRLASFRACVCERRSPISRSRSGPTNLTRSGIEIGCQHVTRSKHGIRRALAKADVEPRFI